MKRIELLLALLVLIQSGFNLSSASDGLKQNQAYEAACKEYIALANSAAEKKDSKALLEITDRFEQDHKSLHLATVFIWHRDLKENSSILFSKTYLETLLPSRKIHYADLSRINVTSEPNGTVFSYTPPTSKVAYRLVFAKCDKAHFSE